METNSYILFGIMTTRTGCTSILLSSDYIFFFHQRHRVFDCLLFGQAALVFSEFIFNRLRPKKRREQKKERKMFGNISHHFAKFHNRTADLIFANIVRICFLNMLQQSNDSKKAGVESTKYSKECSPTTWNFDSTCEKTC